MDLKQILILEFLGNTMGDYAWFIGAILVGLTFKKLISKYLSHLLFKIVKKKDLYDEQKVIFDGEQSLFLR